MIRILFLLCWLPWLAWGQDPVNVTDENGSKQGLWMKYYPGGKLMYEGYFSDDKPAGVWRRYHENGAVKAILDYSDTTGRVAASLFDLSGSRVAEGFYHGELKTGLWSYYAGNTKIAVETYANGKKNGTGKLFYPSGELLEETHWNNDRKSGTYRAFFINGLPFFECRYEDGLRHGFFVTYFPSGAVEVVGSYSEDLPDGEWKFFSQQDTVRFVLRYSKGVLLNPEVLYEIETKQLLEMEQQGKNLTDPEKFMNNPTELLLKSK